MFSASIAVSRVRISICLLCLIAVIPGRSIADNSVILILGDSLSAGYGIDVKGAWPALLQKRLQASGYEYRVENASISGDTTSGGLARLPKLLARHNPSLVVIELGANDGLRGISVDVAERNLARMCDLVNEAGASAVLLEMHVPPNYGAVYADRFNQIYHDIGDSYGIKVVPFFLRDVVLDKSLMQRDKLHPNARAQPIIMEHVWVYLEDELD